LGNKRSESNVHGDIFCLNRKFIGFEPSQCAKEYNDDSYAETVDENFLVSTSPLSER